MGAPVLVDPAGAGASDPAAARGWTPRPVRQIIQWVVADEAPTERIGTMAGAPRVFISYSHDSDEHAARVLALADSFCDRGIDVILDRYIHPAPAEGWPRWMDRNLDEAKFILMVCTETYCRHVMGQEEPGKGHGVRWEGSLIDNRIYHDKPSGSRFIPILLPGSKPAHIPNPVQGHAYYRIATFDLIDPGFEALYRHLTNQPATPRPNPGPITPLPPRPRPRPFPGPRPTTEFMNTVVYGDLVGSTRSGPIVEKVFEAADITIDRTKIRDGNTWDDAFCLVFESPVDAVRFALEVRDKMHWCDWRAKGVSRPPRFRIAIDTGEAGYDYAGVRDAPTGEGPVFREAARNELITPPGRISTTDRVRSLIEKTTSRDEFYFEDKSVQNLATNYGMSKGPIFHLHRSEEKEAIEEGRLGPLLDEQHYRREEALRRFALLWLVLDQLPGGSWGRSTPGWMEEIWRDIPEIGRNPFMEEEGGFETTILNLQLLHHLLGERTYPNQIGFRAIEFLSQHRGTGGFGAMSKKPRDGFPSIAPNPRHTALVGWLLGCILKDQSLQIDELGEMFRFAVTSLLDHEPQVIRRAWRDDRNPMMLYLAAWHSVREVGSADWSDRFESEQRNRFLSRWEQVEPDLRRWALALRYTDGRPRKLAERKQSIAFPLIVPYGQFVRMEAYTLLSVAPLVDREMHPLIRNRLGLGIRELMKQYQNRFGRPENRYTREPLRVALERGLLPYYVQDPEAHPDLGATAMLFRVLRTPAIQEAIWSGEYDPRLMSSVNDVSGIRTEGRNLIIVAVVNNVLHFRIFDGDGKVVVDTDEKRLTKQARQIEDLRKQLESLWPPHELTRSEKSRVITAVTSILPPWKAGVDRVRYNLGEDLVELFDRYLLNPQLYALTNAGMFGSLLVGDDNRLQRQVLDACKDVIDKPAENELRDNTIDKVLSEQKLQVYINQIVARNPSAPDDDPGIQLASRSLSRLLRDRVRPGRYITESPQRLTREGRERLTRMSITRMCDENFCDQFNQVWGNDPDQVILGSFMHLLPPHVSILDLVCGPGQYALEFAKAGHEITVLDVSRPFLRITKDRLCAEGHKAEMVLADVLNEDQRGGLLLRFGEQRFHAIWCSGLFAHIPKGEQHALLEWICRILKDQGFLFVNVMIDNSVLIARDDRYTTYFGNDAEFEEILRECGFRTEFMLKRRINRNTYGDPILSTTWANFCVQKSTRDRITQIDFGSRAALLTAQAYEQSVQAFRRIHSVDAESASERTKYINLYLNKLQTFLSRQGTEPDPISLLDAGCGPGDFTLEAARKGWKAIGIDISSEMIFSARSDLARWFDLRLMSFDLRLMSSLNDVSGIPTEGKNLIIVAAVNNVFQFRIFDGDGKVVVDTDEKSLTEQVRQIEDLREQLESLWPPHELTGSDKDRVVTAVTSIIGGTIATFHVRDLRRLPDNWTSKFDAVLCVTTMQHIPKGDGSLEQALEGFRRVLRPEASSASTSDWAGRVVTTPICVTSRLWKTGRILSR